MVNLCESSDLTIDCNLSSIFFRASRYILTASDFVTIVSDFSWLVVPAVEQVWSLLIFSVNQVFQSSSAHNIGISNQTSPSNLTSTEWFSSIEIERIACFMLCCDKYRYFKYKSKVSEVFLWHIFSFCFRNYSETSLKEIPSAVRTSRQYSLNDHWRLFSRSAILALYHSARFLYFPEISSCFNFSRVSSSSFWITVMTGEPFKTIGAFMSLNVSIVAFAGIEEGIQVNSGLNDSSFSISTQIERQL